MQPTLVCGLVSSDSNNIRWDQDRPWYAYKSKELSLAMTLQRLARLASRQLLKTCIPNPTRLMCRSSSQFTVEHEIAIKGFGKGTNDFVSSLLRIY